VSAQPRSSLLPEALADLADDLDALAWLAAAGRDRLDALGDELGAVARELPGRTRAWMETERRRLRARQAAHARRLERLRDEARASAPSERLRAQLAQAKAAHADLLRAERAALAALVVAGDWQSPALGPAVRAAAGRRAGAIVPHFDDYTRDRHADARAFETAWVAEHLGPRSDVHALLTSCGMAAITTVLGWLGPTTGVALLGRGVYHETRDLVRAAFGARAVTIDETDTEVLLTAIVRHQPGLVVLDTIGNAAGMPVPDLDAVIAACADREGLTLLIDNTACSGGWSPLARSRWDAPLARSGGGNATLVRTGGAKVVVVESLIKHAQLGLDRAPAGLILASGPGTERLDSCREHLGTNVTDYAAVALPPPDRDVLRRRLRRLERNATTIAARLAGVARVSHPSLPDHHAYARALRFRGSFLTLQLAEPHRFPEAALQAALAAGVPLQAGTSFGLDTTRVYAPQGAEPPFARIAAGTEDRVAVERVAAMFADCLSVQL
jgi:cystathionine beta-lyase/cystathionine gamma-synthase